MASDCNIELGQERTMGGKPIRYMMYYCPVCSCRCYTIVTKGERFQVGDVKVWKYSISGNRITVTPSINFGNNPETKKPFPPHRKDCHFNITDEEFKYVEDSNEGY